MVDLHPQSPMAERRRLVLERHLPHTSITGICLRELCYNFPTSNGVAITTATGQELGQAEISRSLGRDPLIKYCMARLNDGTSIEAWISRGDPSVAHLAINGRHIGRCEPSPKRETRISRPGLLNFYLGLYGFSRMWWANRYDLWCGDKPFGFARRPIVVGQDSIRIQHVSGKVLPVNMLSYRSWIRGTLGPNRIIPQDAPLLENQEEEQFYLAASIMFKMLIFEYDLSD